MAQISIIVPFFNAEKYLKRCIESILVQSFTDFELILVNDGSVDSSNSICRMFAKKDNRVNYVWLEHNKGVSDARNIGMRQSTCEYLSFVDSDDWIDENYLELMLNKMKETDADLICCSHKNISNQAEDIFLTNEIEVEISKRTAILGLFKNKYVQPVVWAKLFKKSIILEHNLKFDWDIAYSEDIKFVYEYLNNCRTCYLMKDILYYYRLDNPESAMNAGSFNYEFMQQWLSSWTAYLRMEQFTEKHFGSDKEIIRVFQCSQTNFARMKLHTILELKCQNKEIYQELKNFLRNHLFTFVKYDYSRCSRKVMVSICAIAPKLEFTIWRLIK